MERHFEVELQAIREKLLAMGSLAEAMIQKSVRALVDRDEALVQAVLANEEEMDLLCIEVDDRCFTRLALQQPMASDLRFLVASIKINSDLERMADQAVSIALRAQALMREPLVKPLIDIPRMATLAQEMVRKSLDAFVRRDPELARAVIESDDAVDNLRDQVFRELLVYMMADTATIPRALALILISRNLERIADHATNIAEDVIYIVRGEDVRERGDKELRKGLRMPVGQTPVPPRVYYQPHAVGEEARDDVDDAGWDSGSSGSAELRGRPACRRPSEPDLGNASVGTPERGDEGRWGFPGALFRFDLGREEGGP
jgi:phosphate transport system protein